MNLQETAQNENQTIKKTSLQNTQSTKPSSSIWLSRRFLVVFIMFLCFLNASIITFNICIAVVDMTSVEKFETGNLTQIQLPEYEWDSNTIGLVLSAPFYGGLFSCVGGHVVSKLGGATSSALNLLFGGITTILSPISLYYGFYTFLACRMLNGIFGVLLFTSILEVCAKWIPQNERSKMISFSMNGFNTGLAIVHSLCAFLADGWGWPMIFYATGGLAVITSIICFVLVKNHPSEDTWISKEELAYIQEGIIINQNEKVVHPYKSILTSAPVWALIISRFTVMWLLTIVTTILPLYVKDVTQRDIKEIGILSSLPNIIAIFTTAISGILLDYGKKKDISESQLHKSLTAGSFLINGTFFLSSAYFANVTVSLVMFILIQVFLPIVGLISQIITISIAPNSSSVIAGICAFSFSVSSILARSITGLILNTNNSSQKWNDCFILTGSISLFGAVIFFLFGSSEPQPWSLPPTYANKQNDPNSSNENCC